MTHIRGVECEGLIDNIAAWQDGNEKLDVRTLYDKLAVMYEPEALTNWCARLLFDLYSEVKDSERAS